MDARCKLSQRRTTTGCEEHPSVMTLTPSVLLIHDQIAVRPADVFRATGEQPNSVRLTFDSKGNWLSLDLITFQIQFHVANRTGDWIDLVKHV